MLHRVAGAAEEEQFGKSLKGNASVDARSPQRLSKSNLSTSRKDAESQAHLQKKNRRHSEESLIIGLVAILLHRSRWTARAYRQALFPAPRAMPAHKLF